MLLIKDPHLYKLCLLDYVNYLGVENSLIHAQEIINEHEHDLDLINDIMSVLAQHPAMQTIIDDYEMSQKL